MVILIVLLVALAIFVGAWQLGRNRGLASLGSPEWVVQQAGGSADLAEDPAIVAYARRVRRWRVAGIVGAVVGALVWARIGGGQSARIDIALVIGWFVAGVVPELVVRYRNASTTRVASLHRRTPLRYVTPSARRWWLAALTATAVAPTLALAPGADGPPAIDTLRVAAALAALAVAATAAVLRVTRRPQPAGSPREIAVDEILRQAAVTRAMSGWIALQFIGSFYLAPTQFGSSAGRWAGTVLGITCGIGALAAWAWVPTRISRQTAAT